MLIKTGFNNREDTLIHLPEKNLQIEELNKVWRKKWQPTPISMYGVFHRQEPGRLYSPWGHKESDVT